MKAAVSLLPVFLALLGAGGESRAEVKRQISAEAREILNKAKTIELYSLGPELQDAGSKDKGPTLHDWRVLGKTTVKDAKTRGALMAAFKKTPGTKGAKCFEPRHAVRATHGGKTIDLIICFECSWIYVYEGDTHTTILVVPSKGQPVFDKVLRAAKVPLPKKPKD
jgi:hypothetical protein